MSKERKSAQDIKSGKRAFIAKEGPIETRRRGQTGCFDNPHQLLSEDDKSFACSSEVMTVVSEATVRAGMMIEMTSAAMAETKKGKREGEMETTKDIQLSSLSSLVPSCRISPSSQPNPTP